MVQRIDNNGIISMESDGTKTRQKWYNKDGE